MTNEEILRALRKQNIDVEIQCIYQNQDNHKPEVENKQVKIGYRYLISFWNENNVLIKNIYTNDVYKTYEDAVSAALIEMCIMCKNITI